MTSEPAKPATTKISYPPPLSEAQLSNLLITFTDYALAHGLIVRPAPSFVPNNPNNALATTAPVALWPSPFPRAPFLEARAIQQSCNALYARIASDEGFLNSLVPTLAKVDNFMEKLWRVHLTVKEKGYAQSLSLGMFRSDYMTHKPEGEEPMIRQVEFNTIASSFGPLATKVSEMHRFLWKVGAYPPTPLMHDASLPKHDALRKLAEGLAVAHKAYIAQGKLSASANGRTAVMFVVQDNERNAFDQRWLEYCLLQEHNIHTHRITFPEIPNLAILDPECRTLMLQPRHFPDDQVVEITTVYFRAGYGPGDYDSEHAWN